MAEKRLAQTAARFIFPQYKQNCLKMFQRPRKKMGLFAFDAEERAINEYGSQNLLLDQIPSKKIKQNPLQSSERPCQTYQSIPEIPSIKLTLSDMQGDPLRLLLRFQEKFKEFGAIKLIACDEWSPPFSFKYSEKLITTRIQKLHRLSQGKAFKEKNQEYTIQTFTNFAKEFEKNYKLSEENEGRTSLGRCESEYWRIVNQGEDGMEKVVIEYAADLPVHKYGSGFPLFASPKAKDEHFDYSSSLFNLNNLYKSPLSILQIAQKNKENISGVTIPWVYMGMLFSSFCWHVEDLWINSLNYSHTGAVKTWYIIPESDKEKFDDFVLKKTAKRELLDSITYMIDPLELMRNGIRVYKTYQHPKEYVCTFFKAYHCGFSQGFNVGEAVNFAGTQSLQTIRKAIYFYQQSKERKPAVICYDWLVYSNVKNKIAYPNKIIDEEYNKLMKYEMDILSKLMRQIPIKKIVQMEEDAKYDKNSCSVCRNYLYMSLLKCALCSKNYCYSHARACCRQGMHFCVRLENKGRKKIIEFVRKSLLLK